MRANDVRPDRGAGHRAIVFQSLVHTIGAPNALGSALNRYHTKRNKSEYDEWVQATEAEAEDLLKLAEELEGRIKQWLKSNRPDLAA
jgi:uncharacterized protein (UPF0332 family)